MSIVVAPVPDDLLAPGSLLVLNADTQRRITYCNAALQDTSGYQRGELLGRPLAMLDHPEMPQELRRDLWAALEAGDTWSAVVQQRCKNGRGYWVLATAAPLRDAQSEARFVIAHARPTQEAVRAAQKLYAAMRRGTTLWQEAAACSLIGDTVARYQRRV
jgi:PAS domain S-box-containing protein